MACVGDSTTTQPDASNDSSTKDQSVSDVSVQDVATEAQTEAGPFDANFYGNLELWVSADVGVTVGDGGDVASWQDRSAKHRSVTGGSADCSSGPTLVPSAIHGLPTLQFNGGTQCMTVSGAFSDFTLGFTAFVVMQPGNCNSQFLGNAAGVFDSSDNTQFNHTDFISINRNYAESPQNASGDAMITTSGGGAAITGGGSWVPATAEVLELRFPAAAGGALVSTTAYVNGTFQNNLSPNNVITPGINSSRTTTFIGNWASKTTSGYSQYCGMIGELLIYSKALADADRQAVETYLKTRWSL
jgi:hypothetical protein